jgi:hypothetical protein
MRKSTVLISSVCLSWLLSTIPERPNEAQAAAAAKIPGYEIDYNSSFAGIVKIRFSDKAMNLKLEKMGLTVIAHAPKWNSMVYNEMNKKYMSMTDEQWKTKFASNFSKHKKVAPTEVKIEYTKKTEKIQGLTATKIVLKEKNPEGVVEVSSELWVAKTLMSPPQFKQFLAKALHVPADFQGTPLKISLNQKGKMVQALDAFKVAKVTVTDDDFKVLTGYKEVKNEINLMMDDDEGGGMLGSP